MDFKRFNLDQVKRVWAKSRSKSNDILCELVRSGITWHCGGQSDPFQPLDSVVHATGDLIKFSIDNRIPILFSTKSADLHGYEFDPELHTFQFSVSNVYNRKDIEPNVPDINDRVRLFRELKDKGFRVGIRIQPFIPGVTSTKILELFPDADHYIIEGIKKAHGQDATNFIYSLGFSKLDFVCDAKSDEMLKPIMRLIAYAPFIEWFKQHNSSFSVSDNDLRWIGNNKCCCGDNLVTKSSWFDTTRLLQENNLTEAGVIEAASNLSECNLRCLFQDAGPRKVFINDIFTCPGIRISKPDFQYYPSMLELCQLKAHGVAPALYTGFYEDC